MSIILRPERRLKRPALIPLLGSLAVTEALEKYGVHGRIKWPNDVIVEARKIGGILCESSVTGGSFQWIIVGIGVNVNNPPPILPSINSRYQATAVIQVKDKKTDLSALADSIRDSVLHLYDSLLANGVGNMLREYNKLHVLRNRKVRVLLSNHGIEGVAGEVDVEGRLSVKNSDGSTKMLQSEDVRVVDIL